MTRVRVESFTISLDGYGAGPNQDINNPLGIGGTDLHQWLFPTRTLQRTLFGKDDGTTGVDDDFAAGMAEVIKAGFIADPRILELVHEDPGSARRVGPATVELIERAIALKAAVVTADLREAGLREILNYGHTLGHAIEQHTAYTMRHGEAVAVGMVFAAELAHRAGLIDAALRDRHREVLTRVGLPTTYAGACFDDLLVTMGRDKKTRGSMLRFVVLQDLAQPTRLAGPDEALLRSAYAALA